MQSMRLEMCSYKISILDVLTISFDTPGHLRSALKAHHLFRISPTYLEFDSNFGVAKQECEKQLIRYAAVAQLRAPEIRGRNERLVIEVSMFQLQT
jgi:hypothetical protein